MSLSNLSKSDFSAEFRRDGGFMFPSDETPIEKKQTKGFALAVAQAVWSEYCRKVSHIPSILNNSNDEYTYDVLRSYAEGRQDITKYRRVIASKKPRKNDNGRSSRNRQSWDIESPAPRYVETVREIIKDTDHTIQFRAVDPVNKNLRQRERYALAEQRRNLWLKDRMAAMGLDLRATEFEPQNEEEEDLYMRDVFEFSHERGLSLIVQEIFRKSGIEGPDQHLREDTHDDHFILGVAAWKREVSWEGDKPRVWMRYCDPKATIFPQSRYKDYRDAHYLAELRYMSVGEVRSEIQRNAGKWTAEDEGRLQEAIRSVHGQSALESATLSITDNNRLVNTLRDSHGKLPYDYLKMPVLDGVYCSYDTDTYSVKKTDKTTIVEQAKPSYKPSSPNRKVVGFGRNTWYQFKWIVGSEVTLSWGRMPWNINESPFVIRRVTNRSIVAQMIPILDKLQIIKIKTDKAWFRAAPKGLRINWKELQGMMMNGNKLDPFEALELRQEYGDLVTNQSADTPGKRPGYPVTQEMEGGVGKILQESIQAISFEFDKLNRITGISEAMLGESPRPNQLVGVTELALSGSRSRIKPLYSGYLAMKAQSAKVLAKTVAAIVKLEPDSFPEINESSLSAIKLGSEIYDYEYDIKARIVPNDQMRASLYQDLAEAVANGVIGLDDRAELMGYVESGEFDFARQLLRVRIRNREDRMAAQAQQAQQAEQQRDAAASQGRLQETQARIAAESEKEIAVQAQEGEIERALEILRGAIASRHIREKALAEKEPQKSEKQ